MRPSQKKSPSSDLQSRLLHISDEAASIRNTPARGKEEPSPELKRLCYLVEYLANIVSKHLETGET